MTDPIYPITKFIADAPGSWDWCVDHISHTMTVHQTGVCLFCLVEILNLFKTSHRTKQTSPDTARQGADSPDKTDTNK